MAFWLGQLVQSVLFASVLFLAGCTSITTRGAYEGLRAKPLLDDPAGIVAGIALPSTVELPPEVTRFRIELRPDDPKIKGEKHQFILVPYSPRSTDKLPVPPTGMTLHLGKLSGGDAAKFRAVQRRIADLKKRNLKGVLNMSVNVDVKKACTSEPLAKDAVFVTYMRTSANRPIVQLTRAQPLARDLSKGELRPC